MKIFGFLFLFQICIAQDLRNSHHVGTNRRFFRFYFTFPVIRVVESDPAVKEGNCGKNDFCFQMFDGHRGAIIRGRLVEPISTVVFYLKQSKTPRAIIFLKEGSYAEAPEPTNGLKIVKILRLDSDYEIEFLAVFEDKVENITVSGGAHFSRDLYEGNLHVYSPLTRLDTSDEQYEYIIYMNGYIRESNMYMDLDVGWVNPERIIFYPVEEDGNHYRGYYVTDFPIDSIDVASENLLSWILPGACLISLLSM